MGKFDNEVDRIIDESLRSVGLGDDEVIDRLRSEVAEILVRESRSRMTVDEAAKDYAAFDNDRSQALEKAKASVGNYVRLCAEAECSASRLLRVVSGGGLFVAPGK